MMKMIERDFYDILSEQAEKAPQAEAVVMGDVRLSYLEFVHRIDGVAAALRGRGLERGDKVVLWSVSSPAWLYAYFGIIRSGGIAVVLNANLSTADAKALMEFADTRYVLYGKSHDIAGHSEDAGKVAEASGLREECCISIVDEVFTDVPAGEPDRNGGSVHDDAYILYTSGTTAFPKAVLLSQFSLINVAAQLADVLSPVLGSRALAGMPLFHVYGLSCVWTYLSNGGTVILPEVLKADRIANLVEKEKITNVWSVAPIYQEIIEREDLIAKVAPVVTLCTIGGSYTSPIQFIRYEQSLYHATFVNMYGMTETSAGYMLVRPRDDVSIRYNTVGRPIDGVEVEIMDDKLGILPPSEVGEIVTRGFHLKNGYYKLAREKQGVDENGWFHSGDLGVLDEDRNLRIVGRIKDLIIKGGENIAPAEIETQVMSHPSIASCRVFGYRDRIYGENIGACVILAPGAEFDEDAVRKYVKEKVGSYKAPAYYFVFDSFPLNANGKVDQRSLQIEMLRRLQRLMLEDKLEKGIRILSMSLKNSTYNITPAAALFEECAANLGFSRKKALILRQAVEELLTLRMFDTAEEIGDVEIQLHYLPSFLRITVTDCDTINTSLEDEQRRLATAILMRFADDFSTKKLDSGKYQVRIDFAYDQDVDIMDFLMQHEPLK